ncbi:MAG: hypothetical protein LBK77_00560 [Spirochaetaceae bacterium]|nr:hypothetical protein [Spirochaetaceae bacterium]
MVKMINVRWMFVFLLCVSGSIVFSQIPPGPVQCYPVSLLHDVWKTGGSYKVTLYDDLKTEFLFDLNKLPIDSDGFLRASIEGEEIIVLPGGNHVYFFPVHGWGKNSVFRHIRCVGNEIWVFSFQQAIDYQPDALDVIGGFHRWHIKEIRATSVLTEHLKSREVVYAPDTIHLRVFEMGIYGDVDWASTLGNPPWVEGKADEGIGEGLTIKFTKPVDSMLVLNGYVDPLPQRRHLFKENNRVKVARIVSGKFDFDYTFRDVVELSEIKFPAAVDEVSLIIKDVYYGTKYNDTVITAIMRDFERHEW